MDSTQYIWRSWAEKAHRWGFHDWTASFLEAAGPLTLLGAQAIYLSQPVLSLLVPEPQLEALAKLFEEPEQMHAFTGYLRQEPKP